MITVLLVFGAAFLGFVFGYGRGWIAAFRFLGRIAETEQEDPWVEMQREKAHLQ